MPTQDANGPRLTPDERAYMEFVAAQQKIAHLTPSQQAQVAYELQKAGYVQDKGCCGKRIITDAGANAMWREFELAADAIARKRIAESDQRRGAIEARQREAATA